MLLPSKLCQIEIPVRDLDAAVVFFEAAFGWKQAPAEMHEYIVLLVPDDCPFGISLVPSKSERSGDSTVLYFQVENPQAIVDAVVKNGGKFRFGPKRLGLYGEIFQVEDLDQNRFGLYHKPKTSDWTFGVISSITV